jgi:hypothetical protein
MPVPTAERYPEGLDAYWLGVWRHCLKVMKEQGTWCWEQRPLLDEYVFALMAAKECRADGEDTKWDRHVKRSLALADALVLTPKSRRDAGVGKDAEDFDPFRVFDEIETRVAG